MYRLTNHAKRRIREREMCPLALLAALEEGREYEQTRGLVLRYDAASRYAVVLNPATRVVLTAFRMKKGQLKRQYSRRKGQKRGALR